MRLIRTDNLTLEEFSGDYSGPYAILSHTWEEGEISYQEMQAASPASRWQGAAIKKKPGYQKICNFARVAAADGFEYMWVDTCCIDKSSSAELSESINSMFRWYRKATRCYVYLADVPPGPLKDLHDALDNRVLTPHARALPDMLVSVGNEIMERDKCRNLAFSDHAIAHPFYQSRWYTRGWTLQELIAPKDLVFYYSDWSPAFKKANELKLLSKITGIPRSVLETGDCSSISVADKMRWAANRTTTRTEDMAYCLLGIFDVNMPLLYGEAEKAFLRLQEEICRTSDDQTIFAWQHGTLSPSEQPIQTFKTAAEGQSFRTYRGLFARSPQEFVITLNETLAPFEHPTFIPPFGSTSIGFNAQFSLIPLTKVSGLYFIYPIIATNLHDIENEYLAVLNIKRTGSRSTSEPSGFSYSGLAILLKSLCPGASTRQFVRVNPSVIYNFSITEVRAAGLLPPDPISLYVRHKIRIPETHVSRRCGGFTIDTNGPGWAVRTPGIWLPQFRRFHQIEHMIAVPPEAGPPGITSRVIAVITSRHWIQPFTVFLGERMEPVKPEDSPGTYYNTRGPPTFWVARDVTGEPPNDFEAYRRIQSLEGVTIENNPPCMELVSPDRKFGLRFTLSWLPNLVEDSLVCSLNIEAKGFSSST
ncbi:Heterokaryon incompatibility protein (HET) domain containing protein [Rhypophila decipiens]